MQAQGTKKVGMGQSEADCPAAAARQAANGSMFAIFKRAVVFIDIRNQV
jgi:hypothetical protein